jgi:hypothetical protein
MNRSTEERLGRNEALFREVNERIRDVAATLGAASGDRYEFVCECSNVDCAERIELTLEEYAHVRDDPTRFVVSSGHGTPAVEHVVEREAEHVLVEKDGPAAQVAIALAPRSS